MTNPGQNSFSASPITFPAALCAALGRALIPGDWQVSEQPPERRSQAADLHFVLSLEGELTGECYVAVDNEDAALLAAGSEAAAPAETLLAALQTAANSAVQNALPQGTVTVRTRHVANVPEDAQPVAKLFAVSPERGAASLSLLFSAELAAKLPWAATTPQEARVANLGLVMDVELMVTLRFGQRRLPLREILDLASGSVVELDRQVDEPVELILGGKVIARGEAVIVDGNYGVRVSEVLQSVTL